MLPKHARYQAAPRPATFPYASGARPTEESLEPVPTTGMTPCLLAPRVARS